MTSKNYFSFNQRTRYYNSINKYLKKYYEINGFNNCLKNGKIQQTFRLGEKIVTDNIIGHGSYGIVFSGHFLNSNSLSKKLSLAIKIAEVTKDNELEAELNKQVTQYVINNKCPHFIIFYSILLCDKHNHSIELFDIDKNKYETAVILSNTEYYLILTELAEGVFYDIAAYETNFDIVDNCTIQCLLSMIFFNTLTNKLHDDTHLDNFLYSHIKSGGYFHYNIYGVDYYLKNVGYLIMINDFGLVTNLDIYNLIKDIIYFAEKLNNYYIFDIGKTLTNEMKNPNIIKMNLKHKQKYLYSLLFKLLSETPGFNNHLLTSKMPSSKIINKTPYIIR